MAIEKTEGEKTGDKQKQKGPKTVNFRRELDTYGKAIKYLQNELEIHSEDIGVLIVYQLRKERPKETGEKIAGYQDYLAKKLRSGLYSFIQQIQMGEKISDKCRIELTSDHSRPKRSMTFENLNVMMHDIKGPKGYPDGFFSDLTTVFLEASDECRKFGIYDISHEYSNVLDRLRRKYLDVFCFDT